MSGQINQFSQPGSKFLSADGSGTITLGGTAQNLFGGIQPPHGFIVFNPAATGDTLWFNDGSTAVANGAGSIGLPPGAYWESPPDYIPNGIVSIVAATTGDKFTAKWW